MDEPRVVIVHLRRPTSDVGEMRSDPFWEFGSFGCTKCHGKNLMHVRNVSNLEGVRLAFAQGGPSGFRLVLLSTPVIVKKWRDRCEVRWAPAEMPFRYDAAPVLVKNDGYSDFSLLKKLVSTAHRRTLEGKFSSRFRSRKTPLNAELSREMMLVYKRLRGAARAAAISCSYEQALPHSPPIINLNRRATYRDLIRKASGSVAETCKRKSRTTCK